jgi:hypothetical protein
VQLSSIGKSHEGRDIWLVTVTNSVTGPAEDKPALWIDGNIHAAELTASTACLYFLHQLATGSDNPKLRHLLDTPHGLHLPAPEPRRRRAGAGRPAAAHPLGHTSLPLRRTACRRPDGGGHRRRRPHAV